MSTMYLLRLTIEGWYVDKYGYRETV